MKHPQFFYEGDAGGGSGGGDAGGAGGTLLSAAAADAGSSQHSQTNGNEPAFTWAKEDGSLDPAWIERLSPELKGNPSLKPIGTIHDLAKSYVETKKLIGTKLEAPGENATPEQITNWRKTVGAPEKPEGYYGDAKTLRPEAVPEGMWDTESEKKFLEIAHKHHLPPAAVKEILGYYGENIANSVKASAEQEGVILQQEQTKLRESWGKEFDSNLSIAARVAQTVGLDPKTDPIFTSAKAVEAFAKMGKLLSEDKLVKGENQGVSGSIADKIREIQDVNSGSQLARDYHGQNGPQRQQEAQAILHDLIRTRDSQQK